MSSAPLTQREIADRLRNENLDVWIEPWWATQGTAKRGALELMTAILPVPIAEKLSVLDLCCGPTMSGASFVLAFPKHAWIASIATRSLLSLCAALNARVGIEGEIFTRDMWKSDWSAGLSNNYDAIATGQCSSLVQCCAHSGTFQRLVSTAPAGRSFRVSGAGIRRSEVCRGIW